TSRPIPVGHHDRQPHRLTPPGPGHRAHPRPSVGRDLGHWATRRLHHLQHRQPRKHPPAHRQALHRSAAPRPRHAHHLHDAVHHRNPHHHAIASATGTALRAVGLQTAPATSGSSTRTSPAWITNHSNTCRRQLGQVG